MNKESDDRQMKICKRCKKARTTDIVCTECKVELLNKYDSRIDWKTAFEIERVQRYAMRYFDDDE